MIYLTLYGKVVGIFTTDHCVSINFFVHDFKLCNVCFFIFKFLATAKSCNARTHELVRKITRLCWQHTNSGSHELVPKIRRLCLQHRNSQSHELVPKIRRLCLQHRNSRSHKLLPKNRRLCLQHTNSRARAKNQVVVFAAYERTNSQTHDAALVFVASTHEVRNSRYFQKKGVGFACSNYPTCEKWKKSRVSWVRDLKPKCF